jgi:hypothetical protein
LMILGSLDHDASGWILSWIVCSVSQVGHPEISWSFLNGKTMDLRWFVVSLLQGVFIYKPTLNSSVPLNPQ